MKEKYFLCVLHYKGKPMDANFFVGMKATNREEVIQKVTGEDVPNAKDIKILSVHDLDEIKQRINERSKYYF